MSATASARAYRRRLAAGFVVLFALTQALLWYAYYGHGAKALIGDEQGYQATALAILAGGAWMPGTIWPPLQPLLLAMVYAVFGTHVIAAQLLQSALFVACAALLRDLWRQLGGSVAAANTAAALFLLNPAIAAYAQWLWPEMPHLFLLLAAFCLLARAASPLRALAAGVCMGLAILAKSLLSVFWPVCLVVFVRRARPHVLARPAALFLLGLALMTAPALMHGWREFGRPMIADSSVYNLWIGLTDRWRSDYVDDMGGVTLPEFLASGTTPAQRNAVYLHKLRELVAERGFAPLLAAQLGRQYFRLFSAKTALVSQLPGPVCEGHLSVYRTSPGLTRMLTLLNDGWHALLLVAAAFGIAGWRWRRSFTAPGRACVDPVSNPRASASRAAFASPAAPNGLWMLVVLFVAYQLALMLLIHVKARFLLPMAPFLCGFAGSFLAVACARLRTTLPTTPRSSREASRHGGVESADVELSLTPSRLAIATVFAALLLFLAFAAPALDHLCAG